MCCGRAYSIIVPIREALLSGQVFDLVAPSHPRRITRSDLSRCGAAYTVVGMLCDVTAFWEHDSRVSYDCAGKSLGNELPKT